MVPRLERASVLANQPIPTTRLQLERTQPAADRFGLTLVLASAQTREELETAFRMMVEQRIGAVVVAADVDFYRRAKEISDLALRHRLPSIFPFATAVDTGALMSYGVDEEYAVRHAATYVARSQGCEQATLDSIVSQRLRGSSRIRRQHFPPGHNLTGLTKPVR
jgi:putative ABC transport system substrate-binding protein